MTKARIFNNGRSQAVRIPKRFEFSTREVEIIPHENGLYVYPAEDAHWSNVKAVAEGPSAYPETLPEAPKQDRDLQW